MPFVPMPMAILIVYLLRDWLGENHTANDVGAVGTVREAPKHCLNGAAVLLIGSRFSLEN